MPPRISTEAMDAALAHVEAWGRMPLDARMQAVRAAGRFQVEERGFWAQRDIRQTANNRLVCREKDELVALIRANNDGPPAE